MFVFLFVKLRGQVVTNLTYYVQGSTNNMTTLGTNFCPEDSRQELRGLERGDASKEEVTGGEKSKREEGKEEKHADTLQPRFPPIRACIFDVDGLLLNTEDIYTSIYNSILTNYYRPPFPWRIKAYQQSRGRPGLLRILSWSNLPLSLEEFNRQVAARHERFRNAEPLPGVLALLNNLSSMEGPAGKSVYMAIASSSEIEKFKIKTARWPEIASAFDLERMCVFGEDEKTRVKEKKPSPEIFLLTLEKINSVVMGSGKEQVQPEECLVFEDSIAGVEAARRAGMRVVWVPHVGLRDVCRGREESVLEGRVDWGKPGEEEMVPVDGNGGRDDKEIGVGGDAASGGWVSRDGWAEMLDSLENFPYERYGIPIPRPGETTT